MWMLSHFVKVHVTLWPLNPIVGAESDSLHSATRIPGQGTRIGAALDSPLAHKLTLLRYAPAKLQCTM